MKSFKNNKVYIQVKDMQLLYEVDVFIPQKIEDTFFEYINEMPDEIYSFDDKNIINYLKASNEILDFDEYNDKNLVELYNIVEIIDQRLDELLDENESDVSKSLKILNHNLKEINSLIKSKEKETKILRY